MIVYDIMGQSVEQTQISVTLQANRKHIGGKSLNIIPRRPPSDRERTDEMHYGITDRLTEISAKNFRFVFVLKQNLFQS